jgi:hypothetical protein
MQSHATDLKPFAGPLVAGLEFFTNMPRRQILNLEGSAQTKVLYMAGLGGKDVAAIAMVKSEVMVWVC